MNSGTCYGNLPGGGKPSGMAKALAGYKRTGKLKRTRLKPRIPPKKKLGLD